MELNKCARCGAFFVSSGSVCPNCETKDSADIFKLKSFLEENDSIGSNIENLACDTGISVKNLNRYLSQSDFSGIASNFKIDINEKL